MSFIPYAQRKAYLTTALIVFVLFAVTALCSATWAQASYDKGFHAGRNVIVVKTEDGKTVGTCTFDAELNKIGCE